MFVTTGDYYRNNWLTYDSASSAYDFNYATTTTNTLNYTTTNLFPYTRTVWSRDDLDDLFNKDERTRKSRDVVKKSKALDEYLRGLIDDDKRRKE